MNNDNEININVATNKLTKVICDAVGALTDDDWRESLERALVQAEHIRIEHNNLLKEKYHVTLFPPLPRRRFRQLWVGQVKSPQIYWAHPLYDMRKG